MALIYCDGFDDYGTGGINAVPGGFVQGTIGGVTFTNSGARTGNAITVTANTSFNQIANSVFLTGNPTTVFVGAAFYSAGTNPQYGITLYNGVSVLITATVNYTVNKVSIYRGTVAGTLLANVSYTFPGGWVYLEVGATIDSSNGSVNVYVNGSLIASISGVSTISGGGGLYVTNVYLSHGLGAGSAQVWIDDFYMCDNTTAYNNNVLGPIQVKTVLPNGIGSATNMSVTGVSTNYLAVNNNPEDGDTTYVSSNFAGTLDLYTQVGVGTTGYPYAVMINQIQRLDVSGSRIVAGILQINGVQYTGNIATVNSTSYMQTFSVFNYNPSTLGIWTSVATVNGMQMGTKVIA